MCFVLAHGNTFATTCTNCGQAPVRNTVIARSGCGEAAKQEHAPAKQIGRVHHHPDLALPSLIVLGREFFLNATFHRSAAHEVPPP